MTIIFQTKRSPSTAKATFRFASARIINDSSNITIYLPIVFTHSGSVSDINMLMHYPTTSLKYLGGKLINGKSFDVAGSQTAGRAALHFAANDLNSAPDSILGFADFLWTPKENECDEILFDSLQTEPCSNLQTSTSVFSGLIGSFKLCGVNSVPEHKTFSQITFSISENPARENARVIINNNGSILHYELLDVLGTIQKNGTTTGNELQLNLSGLSSGNYYFRLSEAGGLPTTKKLVIFK